MPLEIPPGFSHVAIQMRHDDDPDPWYITFGVDSTDASGDPEAIAVSSMQAFHAAFTGTISPDVTISGCQVTIGQDGAEPVRAFITPDTELSGTAGDARLPQNCALLIRKNTGVGGRRNRGRMFVPGILAEAAVSATGIISSGATATYAGYAADFFDFLAVAGSGTVALPMFLLHSDGISSTPDPTAVTSLTVDNVISTQRRRLR